MFHGSAATQSKDLASAYKMRLGAWMFVGYAVVYVGFVAINLARPDLMGLVVMLGLNLATVYGFALIVFALFLAVIYNNMCLREERRLAASNREDKV